VTQPPLARDKSNKTNANSKSSKRLLYDKQLVDQFKKRQSKNAVLVARNQLDSQRKERDAALKLKKQQRSQQKQ